MFHPSANGDHWDVPELSVGESALSIPDLTLSTSDRFFCERQAAGDEYNYTFGPGVDYVAVSSGGSGNMACAGVTINPAMVRNYAYKIFLSGSVVYDDDEVSSSSPSNADAFNIFPVLIFWHGNISAVNLGQSISLANARWTVIPHNQTAHGFSFKEVAVTRAGDSTSSSFGGDGLVGLAIGVQGRSSSNYQFTIPRITGSMAIRRYTKAIADFEPTR